MAILNNWIMQIIVLMLIGTIVELLLPSNYMKKYVNLVLGLLLLLILTQPILYLFSTDLTGMMNKMESQLFGDEQLLQQTEKNVEQKKDEIQTTQDAYIWNEISSQMKQSANESVEDTFSLRIENVTVIPTDKKDELESVIVSLTSVDNKGSNKIDSIPPVEIEIDHEKEEEAENELQEGKEIKQHLADLWEVDASQIHLQGEGQID